MSSNSSKHTDVITETRPRANTRPQPPCHPLNTFVTVIKLMCGLSWQMKLYCTSALGTEVIFSSHIFQTLQVFPPLGQEETDTTLFVIWVTNDRPKSLSAVGRRVQTWKRTLLKEPGSRGESRDRLETFSAESKTRDGDKTRLSSSKPDPSAKIKATAVWRSASNSFPLHATSNKYLWVNNEAIRGLFCSFHLSLWYLEYYSRAETLATLGLSGPDWILGTRVMPLFSIPTLRRSLWYKDKTSYMSWGLTYWLSFVTGLWVSSEEGKEANKATFLYKSHKRTNAQLPLVNLKYTRSNFARCTMLNHK